MATATMGTYVLVWLLGMIVVAGRIVGRPPVGWTRHQYWILAAVAISVASNALGWSWARLPRWCPAYDWIPDLVCRPALESTPPGNNRWVSWIYPLPHAYCWARALWTTPEWRDGRLWEYVVLGTFAFAFSTAAVGDVVRTEVAFQTAIAFVLIKPAVQQIAFPIVDADRVVGGLVLVYYPLPMMALLVQERLMVYWDATRARHGVHRGFETAWLSTGWDLAYWIELGFRVVVLGLIARWFWTSRRT